jgi:hypothetical protein
LLGNSWFTEDFWPGEHIYGIVNGATMLLMPQTKALLPNDLSRSSDVFLIFVRIFVESGFCARQQIARPVPKFRQVKGYEPNRAGEE